MSTSLHFSAEPFVLIIPPLLSEHQDSLSLPSWLSSSQIKAPHEEFLSHYPVSVYNNVLLQKNVLALVKSKSLSLHPLPSLASPGLDVMLLSPPRLHPTFFLLTLLALKRCALVSVVFRRQHKLFASFVSYRFFCVSWHIRTSERNCLCLLPPPRPFTLQLVDLASVVSLPMKLLGEFLSCCRVASFSGHFSPYSLPLSNTFSLFVPDELFFSSYI